MSEQEMDLNAAIQLFQQAETFEEFQPRLLDMMTRVHTPEELSEAKKIVNEKKQYMMNNSPEFNAIMEHRERRAKKKGDEDRAIHKAKMAEIEAEAKLTVAQARSKVGSATSDVDDFVAKTRFKVVDPEELERKSKEELYCPICRERDTSHNIVNKYPTCMKCMHKLVPMEDLYKYNRAYRRSWTRRNKK